MAFCQDSEAVAVAASSIQSSQWRTLVRTTSHGVWAQMCYTAVTAGDLRRIILHKLSSLHAFCKTTDSQEGAMLDRRVNRLQPMKMTTTMMIPTKVTTMMMTTMRTMMMTMRMRRTTRRKRAW